MRGVQERGTCALRPFDGDTEDPDEVLETVSKLLPLHGTGLTAHANLFFNVDVGLRKKARRRQIDFMARYGRQSLFIWDDLPVRVLNERFESMRALVKEEGGTEEAFGND